MGHSTPLHTFLLIGPTNTMAVTLPRYSDASDVLYNSIIFIYDAMVYVNYVKEYMI